MPRKTWLLTDDADTYVEQITLGPADVGGSAKGYSVVKRRLRGGLRDGVDVIEVDNGCFWFVVIPTRGMGLWRAKCGDMTLGWTSPVHGPVHPSLVPLWEPSGLGWLSGFDELMVRCGLDSNGAPDFAANGTLQYPLHGKIANMPARHVEVTIDGESGEIIVRGIVEEARYSSSKLRLTSTIRTNVGRPGLSIVDEVTNLSALPAELQLLYHTNFGPPLAAEGATVLVPTETMAPRDAAAAANIPHWNVYGPETLDKPAVCYYFDPAADAEGRSMALLRSASGRQGVSVRFNKRQLPFFTIWKNRQRLADGYVTGLEPATNFPNTKTFEKQHGRVPVLAPGETRRFDFAVEAHPDAASVAEAERAIAAIQGTVVPKISANPDPHLSEG